MRIVRTKKEHLCTVCLKKIEIGKEVFQFFKSGKPNKNLKRGYILISKGITQFRHLECQYKKKPRHVSYEKWIKRIKKPKGIVIFPKTKLNHDH